MKVNASGRNPAVEHILQFFDSEHLREDLKPIAEVCIKAAQEIVQLLPDNPEVTAGLRLLLQAKDAFVRAGIIK